MPQRLPVDAECALDGVRRVVVVEDDGRVLDGLVERQGAEVELGVAVDLDGGEERGVEVPRGEAEGAASVPLHDGTDVVGAELADGAAHTRGAVVVGRDGQRPRAE